MSWEKKKRKTKKKRNEYEYQVKLVVRFGFWCNCTDDRVDQSLENEKGVKEEKPRMKKGQSEKWTCTSISVQVDTHWRMREV